MTLRLGCVAQLSSLNEDVTGIHVVGICGRILYQLSLVIIRGGFEVGCLCVGIMRVHAPHRLDLVVWPLAMCCGLHEVTH